MPLIRRRRPKSRRYRHASADLVALRHNSIRRELAVLRQEQPEALTGSGTLIRHGQATYLRRLVMPWQIRAFGYYDVLGEIKYASQFYSRSLANLELYAAEKNDDGDLVPTENPDAIAALERIKDPGGGGRAGLLADYGRLMFLVGEALMFVSLNKETGLEQWEMLSTDELRLLDGNYTRFMAPTLPAMLFKPAPDDAFLPVEDADGRNQGPAGSGTASAYRLWRRHPRYSSLADATMEGALDIAEELVLLTQVVRARVRSRLATAGILFLDDRITTRPDEPTPDEDALEDPFLEDLTEAITAPITDEGTASAVVPLIARVKVPEGMKLSDLVYHLQVVDPLEIYPETGLRMECIKRLAIVLDMPPEILLGIASANHWCVDAETEILTEVGWRRHDQLGRGDVALTLNHVSGQSEWNPVEDVARFEVSDLPMVSMEARCHSSLTTLQHRWPVVSRVTAKRSWCRSATLKEVDHLLTGALCADLPEIAIYPDEMVELVAWIWTEGEIQHRPGRRHPRVRIYQSHRANAENVARIRGALSGLYGNSERDPMQSSRRGALDEKPRWREVAQADGKTVFSLNVAAAAPLVRVVPKRIVTHEFIRSLTREQLQLFIEVSVRADGHAMSPTGTQIVGQKDSKRLAALEMAAILLGQSVNRHTQMTDGFTRHLVHNLTIHARNRFGPKTKHKRIVRYTGTIWCPVTANGTWLARRHGHVFYTGNSAWMIDEQSWKVHLQPVAEGLVGDLTSAYYQPYLKEQGVEDWGRYFIAYDASQVINHPDRTADSLKMHDRGIVGDATVREAAGMGDDDAPTKDELARIIGMAVRDSSLAWDGIPTVKTGGIEPQPGVIEQAGNPPEGTPESATGAEVVKGPPPAGPHGPDELAAAALASQIAGAAQLALLRAREAAGSRLRTHARRDAEAASLLDGHHNRDVAAALGRVRVRTLIGSAREAELVAGSHGLILDALRVFGVEDDDVAEAIADTVQRHAVRTLYEVRPAPLPPSFSDYVFGLLASAKTEG